VSKLSAYNFIRSFPPVYGAAMSILDTYSWLVSRRRGSYSQHGEDRFVIDFFRGRKKGFYLDIGASHPFRLSNTYLLYRSGWSGATVEPIPRLGKLHRRWRPRDTLMPVAAGVKSGALQFFEMTPSVLSTLDPSVAEGYIANGSAVLSRRYTIDVLPINEIVERVNAIAPVDFLSIDVEGLDAEVLGEIDFMRFRPGLICIEANSNAVRQRTEVLLGQGGYKIVKEIECNLMAAPA
jgi:FkbM family methyltransferase